MPDTSQTDGPSASYFRESFRFDFVAGLTVAVVALPQSMAYAIIAGAPPVFGLYTSFVSCIVASIFGSSRHLITGPTNATALMFAATLTARGYVDDMGALLLYTFLIGAMKFAFGLLRFGRLVSYISDSVIVGFTAGAGVLIAGNQLKHLIGLPALNETGHAFLPGVLETVRNVAHLNPVAVAVGLGTLVVIIGARYIDRRIPGPLVACVGGGLAAYFLHLHGSGVVLAGDLGSIKRGLPPFTIPDLTNIDLIHDLIGGAVAVAVIGLMEATAVSKSIAVNSGQRLNSNREFMAQGLANMVGSFFSCFPSSGSFIRSALNYQAGARTRAASAMSGICVALIVLCLGPLGEYIPVASLAGLLIYVAAQMINWDRLRLAVRAGRESTIVLVATIAATVILPRIDYAIYLGVALSLAFFIRRSAEARVTILVRDHDGFREVHEEDFDALELRGQTVIINVIGAMYFGAMDDHQRRIRLILNQEPRAVVLRLRRVNNIDSSGLEALEKMRTAFEEARIPATVCGVDDELYRILERARFVERMGRRRIVASGDMVFNSIERSVQLAEELADENGGEGKT